MIRFYTREFFEELARRLNEDEPWERALRGRRMRIVCSAFDLRRSFLLDIDNGKVVASEATPETPADYRFEGDYASWVQLCKGEAEFETLIQTGKIRLKGSLPELMGLMGPLNHMVLVARSFPKEF